MKRSFLPALILCLLWILLLEYSFVRDDGMLRMILITAVPAALVILYYFLSPEIFLYLTVFFIPLSLRMDLPGGFSVSVPSELMAVLLLGYFVIHFRKIRFSNRNIFSHPIFIILVIHLLWQSFTSLTSEIMLVSLKHIFIQLLYFAVFYLLMVQRFNRKENILKFFLFYSLGLIIPILHGMQWHWQYNFNPQASYYMPQPFFIEHTVYAAALAFVIPVLIYLLIFPNRYNDTKLKKTELLLLLLIISTGEFFAFSRAAWLSLMILPVIQVNLLLKVRPAFMLTGVIIICIVAIIRHDQIIDFMNRTESRSNTGKLSEQISSVSNIRSDISNVERINRWKCALRMFRDRPFRGYGPGTYQFVYHRFQFRSEMTRISTVHGEKGNSHSEYLGFLAESGILGLIIYLSLIIATIVISLKVIYYSSDKTVRKIGTAVFFALLTFFIHTVFNGFLDTDKIGPLVYGSLAAVTALHLYYREVPEPDKSNAQ